MSEFWQFIGVESNRQRLAWLGAGAVVVIGGLWTAYAHFYPPKLDSGGGPRVEASCASVAIGGSVTGATITAGGAAPTDCAAKPK